MVSSRKPQLHYICKDFFPVRSLTSTGSWYTYLGGAEGPQLNPLLLLQVKHPLHPLLSRALDFAWEPTVSGEPGLAHQSEQSIPLATVIGPGLVHPQPILDLIVFAMRLLRGQVLAATLEVGSGVGGLAENGAHTEDSRTRDGK